MKYLPFKTLIISLLLPPLLYITTLNHLQQYLKIRYTERIDQVYKGDVSRLINGTVSLKETINKNIDGFLGRDFLILLGVKVDVTVISKEGMLLYPDSDHEPEPPLPLFNLSPMTIAAQNYRLLENLKLNVHVKIDHNTPLSSALLILYLSIASFFLYLQYRSGSKRFKQDRLIQKMEIERLIENERENLENIDTLSETKKKLEHEVIKANEDEAFFIKEIESLESKVCHNQSLQTQLRQEIDELNRKVETLKKNGRENRLQEKATDAIRKRFHILYKNTVIHDKAIRGYIHLSDDLKLKAEEIIHRLNETPGSVQIKRKVFCKNNRETVLEVLFGYKCRLYFMKNRENKVEVLTIGTKNTQLKDMGFLNNLVKSRRN